jgi:hypothetical protein
MFIEVTEEWALRTALYAFSTGLFFLSLWAFSPSCT